MKINILMLLFIPLSLNCFYPNWFSKPQPSIQPKVTTIEIFDPINFSQCATQLYNVAKDSGVVGVILKVNSSGGPAGDFSVIHDMIKKLTTVKPVVCLVMGEVKSGGYLIASAANYIFAHSISEIGSIGAVWCIDRYKNAHIKDSRIKADFTEEIFKAGEFKAMSNPFSPDLTESQRNYIQAEIVKSYDTFINLVTQNRSLNKDDYKMWAEGKLFEATEALELGLIDEIGTIFEAQEKIKDLIVKRDPNCCTIDAIEFVQ